MRMLFATDGSSGANAALEFLAALPLGRTDRIAVLSVVAHGQRPEAQEIAEAAARRFEASGIRAAVHVDRGAVVDAILATALDTAADVVVVGSRGLGAISGKLLGSTARAIAREAAFPVLAVRDRQEQPRHVLAVVDGSPEAERALALLVRLPLPHDAGTTYLQLARPGSGAADAILAQAARASSDLIVLGTRGQTARHGLLETSLADQILSRARCAVLVASGGIAPLQITAPAERAVAGTA